MVRIAIKSTILKLLHGEDTESIVFLYIIHSVHNMPFLLMLNCSLNHLGSCLEGCWDVRTFSDHQARVSSYHILRSVAKYIHKEVAFINSSIHCTKLLVHAVGTN